MGEAVSIKHLTMKPDLGESHYILPALLSDKHRSVKCGLRQPVYDLLNKGHEGHGGFLLPLLKKPTAKGKVEYVSK